LSRYDPELDRRLMSQSVELARQVLGLTSPNPAVGCVIVRGRKIVGRAATAPGGRPHAEPLALRQAGEAARGATAYVSFEPCSHYGQTPPCAKALIDAGLRRVVVGCLDPYPPVRGRGITMLRRAGVEVTTGVLEQECRRINEGFITRVTRGRPFGLLKLALSLDGRIAAASGDSRWISSPASRELVHRWRRECDAVMVGAGTVLADDPRLTCRLRAGRDPVRVIIDPRLRTPARARVFRERSSASAILVTLPQNLARAKRSHAAKKVEVMTITQHGGEFELGELMREFARRGWCKVLIEGGAHLAAAALRAGIVDRVAFFFAPKIVGSGLPAIEGLRTGRIRDAIRLANVTVEPVGEDWLFQGEPTARTGGFSPSHGGRR
jgi:diaminohydroxyphosphoribosylaminopyrimidine deaminase / 5-amino-6-(5-phosphoribosylamino)uracil reductase